MADVTPEAELGAARAQFRRDLGPATAQAAERLIRAVVTSMDREEPTTPPVVRLRGHLRGWLDMPPGVTLSMEPGSSMGEEPSPRRILGATLPDVMRRRREAGESVESLARDFEWERSDVLAVTSSTEPCATDEEAEASQTPDARALPLPDVDWADVEHELRSQGFDSERVLAAAVGAVRVARPSQTPDAPGCADWRPVLRALGIVDHASPQDAVDWIEAMKDEERAVREAICERSPYSDPGKLTLQGAWDLFVGDVLDREPGCTRGDASDPSKQERALRDRLASTRRLWRESEAERDRLESDVKQISRELCASEAERERLAEQLDGEREEAARARSMAYAISGELAATRAQLRKTDADLVHRDIKPEAELAALEGEAK